MFNFPWTNFHELNLDWILSVVKEAKEVFDEKEEQKINNEIIPNKKRINNNIN